MKEINKLEEYLKERSEKRNKRNRLLAILFTIFAIIGIAFLAFWGYNQYGGETPSDEISQTNLNSNENSENSDRNINESPSGADIAKQFPSLSIEGSFQKGVPMDFIIKNYEGDGRHFIDFGDAKSMPLKNFTKHVYRKAGEYQIKFLPAGFSEPVVETINIKNRSNSDDESFVKLIESTEINESDKAFVSQDYDNIASFPGGTPNLMSYLQIHIGNVSGYEGRVLVSFTVKSDGTINNLKILDSVNTKLDNQVLSAFDGMPKWTPAKREGINVDSEYRLPFYFKKDS